MNQELSKGHNCLLSRFAGTLHQSVQLVFHWSLFFKINFFHPSWFFFLRKYFWVCIVTIPILESTEIGLLPVESFVELA